METYDIATEVLKLIDKQYSDKVNNSSSILIGELVESLIFFPSMKEAALVFNISDSAIEHVVSRHLKKLFPTKPRNSCWDNYLLGLISLRKCSVCKDISSCDNFYTATESTLYSRCKKCSNAISINSRPKYKLQHKEYSRKHYLEHKHDYILKASKRRKLLYTAMPPWANLSKLKEIYKNCPTGMHVDHIIPLQGNLVCGLHVENNLQYLTAEDNLKKSNKFLVD